VFKGYVQGGREVTVHRFVYNNNNYYYFIIIIIIYYYLLSGCTVNSPPPCRMVENIGTEIVMKIFVWG
jgi:hypothetical protein